MKIIDDKGRLLGKINVIDFLVITFFISLTPMFYLGYKIFHTKQNVEIQKKEFKKIELNLVFKKISPQVLGLISVGDKETGETKETIGEISDLGEARPYGYEVNVGSSKKTIIDSVLKDLPVIMRIKAEVRQNNLYYKDRQISDNSVIDFVTDKYRVEALYEPVLATNDNRLGDISNRTNAIQQKLKELKNEESQLENKVNLLEGKINSLEASLATEEQKAKEKK
jgi:hypothetical protein